MRMFKHTSYAVTGYNVCRGAKKAKIGQQGPRAITYAVSLFPTGYNVCPIYISTMSPYKRIKNINNIKTLIFGPILWAREREHRAERRGHIAPQRKGVSMALVLAKECWRASPYKGVACLIESLDSKGDMMASKYQVATFGACWGDGTDRK